MSSLWLLQLACWLLPSPFRWVGLVGAGVGLWMSTRKASPPPLPEVPPPASPPPLPLVETASQPDFLRDELSMVGLDLASSATSLLTTARRQQECIVVQGLPLAGALRCHLPL